MEYTLTVLDTASIQSYIFGSNELRENVGASHLVHLATTQWVQDTLNLDEVVAGRHNYKTTRKEKNKLRPYKPEFLIEEQMALPCAEVMYAGGGNTFILFRGNNSLKTAQEFVYQLSLRVIKEAPGLSLYAAHDSFDWNASVNVMQVVENALEHLAELKTRTPVFMPTLGLSVTADCTSTGLPANSTHPDPDKQGTLASRANRQVLSQWHAAWHSEEYKKQRSPEDIDANDRLRGMFGFVDTSQYDWTNDLDKIGKLPERDESFIAVVHADGNGMGKQMRALSNFFKKDYPNELRAYITVVRALSLAYNDTAQAALKCTVRDLYESLAYHENHPKGDKQKYYGRAKNSNGMMTSYFPFRPIVFGGDDVTWVCAGPWGVPMAHRYLTYLEKQQLPSAHELLANWHTNDTQKKAHMIALMDADEALKLPSKPYACAGVSIVKTHYPISRAYDNSEELLKSAKSQVYLYNKDKKKSAIDWHITTTGLAGSLAEIREREYETTEPDKVTQRIMDSEAMYKLTIRPLLLDEQYTWRNWQNFYDIFTQFQLGWFGTKNKMMKLREAVRGGPAAVADFKNMERKGTRLPTLSRDPFTTIGSSKEILEWGDDGWVSWSNEKTQQWMRLPGEEAKKQATDPIRCAYFDAIEIADYLLTLVDAKDHCEELS